MCQTLKGLHGGFCCSVLVRFLEASGFGIISGLAFKVFAFSFLLHMVHKMFVWAFLYGDKTHRPLQYTLGSSRVSTWLVQNKLVSRA